MAAHVEDSISGGDEQAREKRQSVQGLAWGADIGLGVGVVGLAVGTYLLFTAPKPPTTGLSVTPLVGPRGGGVSTTMEF